MNEAQRAALQRHTKQLANDLICSEELMGDLYQDRVFDRHMLDMIRNQPTESDRVYKMLELLPRRGPNAFDTFINIIQDAYPWLAAMLESTYQTEKSRLTSRTASSGQINQLDRMISCADTPRADTDIKRKVGTFVHKQFGQSKRISQTDKKAVERFLIEQVNEERIKLQSVIQRKDSVDEIKTETDSSMSQITDVQERLFEMYVTLETCLDHKNNHYLPEDMTFALVLAEIKSLTERTKLAEDELTECLSLFNEEEKTMTLASHIERLQNQTDHQEEKLQSQENRIEQLQSELNEYSLHIEKLEAERKTHRSKVDYLSKEVSVLRHDKFRLEERCTQLEKIQQQHIEKEKTLENLKSVVRDLEASKLYPNRSVLNRLENMESFRTLDTNTKSLQTRKSLRVGGERFGRATPKPNLNSQITRQKYINPRSSLRRKPPLPKM